MFFCRKYYCVHLNLKNGIKCPNFLTFLNNNVNQKRDFFHILWPSQNTWTFLNFIPHILNITSWLFKKCKPTYNFLKKISKFKIQTSWTVILYQSLRIWQAPKHFLKKTPLNNLWSFNFDCCQHFGKIGAVLAHSFFSLKNYSLTQKIAPRFKIHKFTFKKNENHLTFE